MKRLVYTEVGELFTFRIEQMGDMYILHTDANREATLSVFKAGIEHFFDMVTYLSTLGLDKLYTYGIDPIGLKLARHVGFVRSDKDLELEDGRVVPALVLELT